MARPRKFPDPSEITDRDRLTFRNGAIAIEIYNQATNSDAHRLAGKVQSWFRAEAKKKGWAAVFFPRDYPTDTIAGVVFLKAKPNSVSPPLPRKKSKAKKKILVHTHKA